MERIFLHYDNPNKRDVNHIVKKLKKGAIMIFPTDTIYALGCLMTNKKGVDRIIKVTGKKEKHAKLSMICPDISTASQYTANLDNNIFKVMKRVLPGPFTFILQSSTQFKRIVKAGRSELGIRIPNNKILQVILEELDEPLMSTSLKTEDEIQPYYIDPDEIYEEYQHQVDILVDGGPGDHTESTVIDYTDNQIIIVREGKGDTGRL